MFVFDPYLFSELKTNWVGDVLRYDLKFFSSTFSYKVCSATNSVPIIHYLRGGMMQQKAEVNLGALQFQQSISQESIRKNLEHKK